MSFGAAALSFGAAALSFGAAAFSFDAAALPFGAGARSLLVLRGAARRVGLQGNAEGTGDRERGQESRRARTNQAVILAVVRSLSDIYSFDNIDEALTDDHVTIRRDRGENGATRPLARGAFIGAGFPISIAGAALPPDDSEDRIMTAKTSFRGSFTALVTPFSNGALDEKAFRGLVDWQIAEGTNGLVPVGTTGESPTLSHEEHKRVVKWCIEQANGRVPVVAGAGSNSTREAIDFAQHAEKAGADAVLIVTPYYNKPTQEGLYQHFKAINDAIGIPIIIYNIPVRSVIDMSVDTMKRLFALDNIAGVKDATANVVRVSQQRAAMGEEFNQLSGEDATVAGLHGAWRARLHLGDLERGAQALRRIPGRLFARRLSHRARLPRQADAAAHRAVHRNQSGTGQICAGGARQVRRDGASAHGAGRRDDQGRRARRHGPRRADQLADRGRLPPWRPEQSAHRARLVPQDQL